MLCIKNGTLHTAVSKEPVLADILIDAGKIVEIAPQINGSFEKVINASGLDVWPGFVEAHCHIGLDGYGSGNAGADYNETNDPVTPQLRAIDGINAMDPCLNMAAKAGITCFATGPGSTNALGGTFTAIKPNGKRVDNMIVKEAIAMKCAFGENPKRRYGDKKIATRMTNVALIRVAKEFGLDITLEHVTEGHLIVDELVKENLPLAVGPSFGHASKFEMHNKCWETAGILANAGYHVSIITDAPVVPLHYLPLLAGFAIKAGMGEYDALRAITICAAEHIGIADRVGSLEVGKDADVVITNGSPFEISGQIHHVLIDGNEIR